MSKFLSGAEKRKTKFFLRKILELFHLRMFVYRSVITPNQEIALNKVRKIAKNSSPIEKKSTGKKIIFNSIDARYMLHTYTEVGLAKALQIRGHEVKMLICGNIFDTCVGHYTIKNPPTDWGCKNCVNFSKRFYKASDVPYSTYSNYISNNEVQEIREKVNNLTVEECSNFVYKDVNVGVHAQTSAERYFVGGEPDKKLLEKMLREELVNSIITTEVAEEIVKKENPDILVTSHGCYSHWGSFADFFVNKGLRIRVWFTSYKGNTLIFDNHKLNEYFKMYYNEIRKKKTLDGKEEQVLNGFLEPRMRGEEGDTAYYGFSDKHGDLREIFEIDQYEKNYFIFPNVPWDRSIVFLGEKVAFEDVYEWVSSTIDYFKNQTKKQLIIKIHPGEIATERSEKTMLEYINEKYPELPKNIKIIPPDTDISPYSLFPYIDVGIVCNGTIGLEMSTQNIPVIITGRVHYSRNGFTHDVTTKEEYFNKIEHYITPLPNQQALAKTYAYFFFIKSGVPRNFVYYNNFLDLGWRIKSFDDLGEGNDKYLDHICNYITENKIYQDW